MRKRVLLIGAHASSGHGPLRLTKLYEQAWHANGVDVLVLSNADRISRHIKADRPGRGLATLESAAGLGRRMTKLARDVDLVHIVDLRDAVWATDLPGELPVTVTCHDMGPVQALLGLQPGRRSRPLDRFRGHRHIEALQRADHLMATSQATADIVHRLTGRPASVLHLPVDPTLRPDNLPLGRHRPPAWPYLLVVAGTGRADRRELALQAWISLRRTPSLDGASLVVVGPPLTPDEEATVTGCGGHVDVISDPTDEQLRTLYSGAEALLALGLPGSFAWPIAEAQAAGRPVIATDAESFHEVGADGCVYLPTSALERFDPATWAAIAQDVTADTVTTRARTNALRFGWDAFVAQLPTVAMAAAGTPARRKLVVPPSVPAPRVPDPDGVVRLIDLTDDLMISRPVTTALAGQPAGQRVSRGSRPAPGR
jgi:glycosyltransferase involved in cell wall biosynthesis